MLPTEHLLAFMLIATVLIVVPGPSVLFVVTRSLTLGPRAGIATAIGNAAGVYVQVVLVAVGVGAIVQESIAVFTALKLAARRTSCSSACRPFATATRSSTRCTCLRSRSCCAGCWPTRSWSASPTRR